ncbi:MAG: hypothetical protein MI724_09875, partial [Spirochaetales bacterium]|nr:hypothetical protein [Spirochaetales bacterium]
HGDESVRAVLTSTAEASGGVPTDDGSSSLTVGLLRIDLSMGLDGRRLRVRFAPALPLRLVTDEVDRNASSDPRDGGAVGIWSHPLSLDVDQSIAIRITTRESAPPLWWFPPPRRVVSLDIVSPGSDGERILYRRPDSSIPSFLDVQTYLGEYLIDREMGEVWPADGTGYLQPGVYALSIAGGDG